MSLTIYRFRPIGVFSLSFIYYGVGNGWVFVTRFREKKSNMLVDLSLFKGALSVNDMFLLREAFRVNVAFFYSLT
jgi:hypothetical protein